MLGNPLNRASSIITANSNITPSEITPFAQQESNYIVVNQRPPLRNVSVYLKNPGYISPYYLETSGDNNLNKNQNFSPSILSNFNSVLSSSISSNMSTPAPSEPGNPLPTGGYKQGVADLSNMKPISSVIIPTAIDTAVYVGAEALIYGMKEVKEGESRGSFPVKDIALFAVSDGISMIGLKDWVKYLLSSIVNMPDSMLMDYISYVVSTDGVYQLINMGVQHHKQKWHLFMETSAVYAVNTLYYYFLANKIQA